MNSLTDKEIYRASETIDKALAAMNKTNRGEVAVRILSVVRNLNDHIADKVWSDLRPNNPMDINRVAKKFAGIKGYQFISRFDKFLRKSVSHFTPDEEGAERLLLKYYKYILQLKKLVYDRYKMDIIKNIDCFLDDLDEQTQEYYRKISEQIDKCYERTGETRFDNYYIDRIKPFFVNHNIYYEVTLEIADERPNKFNRITAFTKEDIFTNYCVALNFMDIDVDIFGVKFPIKVITEWHVSIRPCEINNFAKILNLKTDVQRGSIEYRVLMEYLKDFQISLIDIINIELVEYNKIKKYIVDSTKNKHSYIFDALDKCREVCLNNKEGKNILLYLLNRMRNSIIKDQWTDDSDRTYGNLYLSTKCVPFDQHPFSFNPRRHTTNLYDLFECIEVDSEIKKCELLARKINENTNQKSMIFTQMEELSSFGDSDKIKSMVQLYNDNLYSGFRPKAELEIYKNYVYSKGHEIETIEILKKLKTLANEPSSFSDNFTEDKVDVLKELEKPHRLDDAEKSKILNSMFSQSRVHLVYGAAGTGKTTLVNHICNLMDANSKLFLAKTNPAVENLKRKVTCSRVDDVFITIDRFNNNSRYNSKEYDLIVVDECSTVKNEDILKILDKINEGILVLVGDTYQIESIGFGNWFSICRNELPDYCRHELTIAHRSSDEFLKKLWEEVRNMSDDNVVLEEMVRSEYSHPIDDNIFIKRSTDEIILCLNYNGLYGLNNINRLLQINNPNKAYDIGIWRFKVGDPILFNDSGRFNLLYNNLKGEIIDIEDYGEFLQFVINVNQGFSKEQVENCNGLSFIKNDENSTTISFSVNRRLPYSSDEESSNDEHILPFQVAYAVSIHKSQGLEYDSVKIVISDETEDRISHNIFYTAITRARSKLKIYWSPEVCNRILSRIRPTNYTKDYNILKSKKVL